MNINTRAVSILLVDDDEINNFISIKLIRKALFNADITACLNGKFAIDQLVDIQRKGADKLPDYILLDINMPIMNGWEFLDEYKRLGLDPLGKTKIFIISSSVFSNDINKARSYPLVKSFISKPLSVDKIKEMFTVTENEVNHE
jgi:CheY-like chemotaxis protein